ncbi:hypothetical protein V7659_23710 [Neobacillus drentensis]|uniref:hypothetical protein n=1 Tax=Neobacillus drentensis TaxID=220684 RepID=UPI002FFF63BD
MPDVLEAVKNVLQSLMDDEPKSPLHVGEVMSFWSFLSEMAEEQVHSEAGINSTTDPELKQAFHASCKNVQISDRTTDRIYAIRRGTFTTFK